MRVEHERSVTEVDGGRVANRPWTGGKRSRNACCDLCSPSVTSLVHAVSTSSPPDAFRSEPEVEHWAVQDGLR
jgi:hypothetical protein